MKYKELLTEYTSKMSVNQRAGAKMAILANRGNFNIFGPGLNDELDAEQILGFYESTKTELESILHGSPDFLLSLMHSDIKEVLTKEELDFMVSETSKQKEQTKSVLVHVNDMIRKYKRDN